MDCCGQGFSYENVLSSRLKNMLVGKNLADRRVALPFASKS
jgi:hypothetical protein